MTHRPIRFFHRGAIVEVDGAAPTRTVLEWLREDARCTGTKEGCNEGDCGACTVVVGELPAAGAPASPDDVGGLRLAAVNACIRFLPTLDGKALFSVEDVALTQQPTLQLHPVQQALVDCHGSQCGFCTPGFVMSLWACWQQHRAADTRPSRQALADALSGNLCRCTGYRPILDAAERMFELPAPGLDTAAAVAALRSLQGDEGLQYEAGGGRYAAPRTAEAFAAERAARPEARVLAGATDIGLWVNKSFRALPDLLSIGDVAELRAIRFEGDVLSIGAAAPLEDAWRALAAWHPSLGEVWKRFAGLPTRQAGTMGGNVANGSPIGDAAPVLMALGARLTLRRGNALRTMPLDAFYAGYMKNALEPGEFLQSIEVERSAAEVRAWKISKRFDSDISALCAGLAIELDGGARISRPALATVTAARFAFGGMAATVRRAAAAEAAVVGAPWNEATVAAARAALAADFQPLTDMRAGAAYRLQVAQNLLTRLWLETRADAPLDASTTQVWSALQRGGPGSAPSSATPDGMAAASP